jgi:hypothetical protein
MNLALSFLGRVACRDIFSAMGFRIISGTADQEFVENVESATAALDRVRQSDQIEVAQYPDRNRTRPHLPARGTRGPG